MSRLKKHSYLENYILLDLNIGLGITQPMSIYTRDVLKIIKKYNIRLDRSFEEIYLEHKKIVDGILRYLDKKYFDNLNFIGQIIEHMGHWGFSVTTASLIAKNHYEYKRLLDAYYDYYRREAIDVYRSSRLLSDYSNIQKILRKKYRKYPKFLQSVHDITVANFNIYKIKYEEELFQKRIDLNLEYQNGEYSMIYPKSTEEVKSEGIELAHCVKIYIDEILSGTTNILFLRKTDEPDKSLVTIEIRNGILVQAEGIYRRSPNESEEEFIEKYCRVKNIQRG